MSYHLHMSGESRDCDGKYSHGHDIMVRRKRHEDQAISDFPDLEAVEYAVKLAWRLPDSYTNEPVTITISRLGDGRIMVEGGGPTDEGYWAESYVVCDEDDFDADYSGYRDHSAEAMGY